MSEAPRIWVLLGTRRGDNNQLFALAEALGLPFETKTLHYRWFARAWLKLFGVGVGHLTAESRRTLAAPWPSLVIGIGRRSVPVARWIKARGGGRAKLVRVGHPRADSSLFDLVITTAQYPVGDAPNVLRLPLAMNRFRDPPEATEEERAFLDALPRPLRLVSLGGTAPMWRLDMDALEHALRALGPTLVIPSPRTPPEAIALIRAVPGATLADPSLRYAVALAAADEHFVTADSVSMISEAIMTGKPVGLIPVTPDARGERVFAAPPEKTGIRDIRRFWKSVEDGGLVGTVDGPRAGTFSDPVAMAADAVRALLGRGA